MLALEIVLSSHSLICGRVWVGLSLVPLVVKVLPEPTWNKERVSIILKKRNFLKLSEVLIGGIVFLAVYVIFLPFSEGKRLEN